jgi:hypothetical protein
VQLYQVITQMRTEASCYSIAEMGLTFGLSRSGLYDHTRKHQGQRRQQDAALAERIALIFLPSRNTYGSRRIQQMLLPGHPMRQESYLPAHGTGRLAAGTETSLPASNHSEVLSAFIQRSATFRQ